MSPDLRPLSRLLIESAAACDGPLPVDVAKANLGELIRAGSLHRINPAIWRRIAERQGVPPEWSERLKATRQQQIFRHLQALHDLGAIVPAFEARGVRWAVAKGPVLADVVWPHPDMREYTDLDVFVHPADFAIALETLERLQFVLVDRNWPEIHRLGRAELAMRGPSGFPLDLHWDIAVALRSRRAFPTDLPGMLSRRRSVSMGNGLEVPTLDPTDTVLHTAYHAAQAGANRLMWIADIHYAARASGVDWEAFDIRAAQANMTTMAAVVLGRVERTFGERFPVSESLRHTMQRSLAGRIAAYRESRHPFPGLPGDSSLSGTEYSSARDSAALTAFTVLAQWVEVRQIEARVRRQGTMPNPLDEDIPDMDARREYLSAVARAA
ncbi:nucleotidyltransferase family protein [Humibacter ginsengisoli]